MPGHLPLPTRAAPPSFCPPTARSEYNIKETAENARQIDAIVQQVGAWGAGPGAGGGPVHRWSQAPAPPCSPALRPRCAQQKLCVAVPPTLPSPSSTSLQAWAALRPDERAPFESHAVADRRRYDEEHSIFVDMQVGHWLHVLTHRQLG